MRAAPLLVALLFGGCPDCADPLALACDHDVDCPDATHCTAARCLPSSTAAAEGEGAGEGEGAVAEGEGAPAEGEGDAAEGEGAPAEGEGEGTSAEGEGAGEGEGEGEGEGGATTFQRWNPYEPNDFLLNEDCLSVATSAEFELQPGDWNDQACGGALAYVCAGAVVNGCVPLVGDQTLCPSLRSWDDARASCVGGGGDLAVIHDDAENDAIVALANGSDVWIGGSDAVEGDWRWVDGSPVTVERFQSWAPARPNGGTAENCLGVMLSSETVVETIHLWNDLDCNSPRPYVCEFVGAVPLSCTTGDVGPLQRLLFCSADTYANAIATCASVQGVLVRDFHAAFHDDLITAAEAAFPGADAVWLGADDLAAEGTFEWQDGAPVPVP